ncbi:hypothetical protein ABIE59_003898 [Marinobacter sp. MBR-99]|uniref:hypothetical protein n=1 Tax=Marinobacter sp. MBR-99 TaxID=3156461 RepID=UPI003399A21E
MKYFVLVAIAMLAGCATTTTPITAENAQKLTGESLVTAKRESPSFVAMTSTKGMFALVGAVTAISAGNELVESNNIEDPAPKIADTLANRLAEQYSMAYKGQTDQTITAGDASAIAKAVSDDAYVVNVATRNWSFIYDGFNFSDYSLTYIADLKLIDTRIGKAISEGSCTYETKEEIGTVPYETLVADNAAFIKEHLSAAADRCLNEFSTELFRL